MSFEPTFLDSAGAIVGSEYLADRWFFLDETWLSTNMARRRGRCARGQGAKAAPPCGHWKTTTFLAGLGHEGVIAPPVLNGPIGGENFHAYVEQFPAPALRPRQIVAPDNLASHKVVGVHHAIEAAGAHLLHLPRYSPDLNPILNLFAKLEALIRKVAARTVDALWTAVNEILRNLQPRGCRSHLAHAGYRHSI